MTRWYDISPEPNSPEAKRFRMETLRSAWRQPVVDRNAYLESLARDRGVLDVGVVAHTSSCADNAEWLHRTIAKAARSCLGVDILDEDVRKLQAAGFNVRRCDITQASEREALRDAGPFEVIIIGEVIEHLGNPAALLEGACDLLAPAGLLVLTTPNPYYWKRIRNFTFSRYRATHGESVDHVALLFPSSVAELAQRAGLALESYRGVMVHKPNRLLGGLGLLLKRWAGATMVAPEFFCETIIYECRAAADSLKEKSR